MDASTVRELLLLGAALWNQESRKWLSENVDAEKFTARNRRIYEAILAGDGKAVREWLMRDANVKHTNGWAMDSLAKRMDGWLSKDFMSTVAGIAWDAASTRKEKLALLKKLVEQEEK